MFKKKLTPIDHVKHLKDNLVSMSKLEPSNDKKFQKLNDEISQNLLSIKTFLYGSTDQEPQADIIPQVAQEIYQVNLLIILIENLHKLEFEARKDVAQILSNLLKRKIGTRSPTITYIQEHQNILNMLMNGYENPEIALNTGQMLRDCIRYEELAKIVLNFSAFYKLFDYVEMSAFDIASDVFATFKDLLTKHKILAADFLDAHYKEFFRHYDRLLNSENYVTRRQALKLLGELLLDRHNFTIMTLYISNPDNLKLMMNMLKQKSRNIQFEAFHVFKVFVANPNKPRPIQEILYRNREKLIDFLTNFHNDRTDDDQFNEEKAYLIKQVKDMKELDPA
ncbi:hypothetical protein HELRODRAFT_189935 [Helobdella robusta]|uniref:Uncharacterized protein n=1 Tax=Helobdella robusta TaxID=6412 RepID=T1FRI0_HELRO|nr:hypothetical protein HELRODRAFT_189935 [Helobdella robusta]ESN90647.1 hypothetical protein HELRODRAFT_189935 [Helobdella robusta]